MVRYGLLITCLVAVSACTPIVENSQRAVYKVRGAVYDATEKMQSYLAYSPDSDMPQAPQTRYCYKVIGDVVCYREPQPFLSNPLVGRQGVTPYEYSEYKAPVTSVSVIEEEAKPAAMESSSVDKAADDVEFEEAQKAFKRRPRSLMPRY